MTAETTPAVVIAVLVAGAVGAVIRFALSRALPVRPGRLPVGILVVNVIGSALAGALLGLAERAAIGHDVQLILVTGFCGGLTTFSTWSVETIELLGGGRWRAAVLNVLVTLVLGAATAGGMYLLLR
ncbi:fluoride efflux transporter CrcB [Agromyces salentinus]|uniref:Fluoride-specific ion channel FluC n=1 Tax=Agromyces salentinus TaxID=269421 RepID=A0ABP4ZDA0_9MICO|nr:fluoride efflux transporter CrcB [Agromyces salentinus]